jgi:hypothetical protein
MAKRSEAPDALTLVRQLLETGQLDSVYRDVYLERAAEMLAPTLSREAYDRSREKRKESARLLEENRRAVELRDWARAKEISRRAEAARADLTARADAMSVAEELYEGSAISLDPFSPGHDMVAAGPAQNLTQLRTDLLAKLDALAKGDAPRAPFYVARRTYFAALTVADALSAKTHAEADPAALEREAAAAAARGEFDRVAELADELMRRQQAAPAAAGTPTAAPPDLGSYESPVDLGAPFSGDAVQRARGLGLAAASLPLRREDVGTLIEFLLRNAWHPSFREAAAARDGVLRLSEAMEATQLPAEVSAIAREFVELFMRNPYVNSGGARYLPLLRAETFLVEDFPEEAEVPAESPLLATLNLPRRRALSRLQIEEAVAAHGKRILSEELALDPVEYRIVCVPYDVYVRFGLQSGWGQQAYWTHFDGYQVMPGASLRALVGGSVRYGGVADLVSISRDDERDGVIARFAVVRRARLVARWR